MKIITVIPLSRGIFTDHLTYFSSISSMEIGSLVYVPLKTKTIPAVVILIQDAQSAKTQLKQATFSIKSKIISNIYTELYKNSERNRRLFCN